MNKELKIYKKGRGEFLLDSLIADVDSNGVFVDMVLECSEALYPEDVIIPANTLENVNPAHMLVVVRHTEDDKIRFRNPYRDSINIKGFEKGTKFTMISSFREV